MTRFTILKARRYDTGEPVSVAISGDRIAGVEPAWPMEAVDQWPYVAPGLFDLQVNGHGGAWFSDASLSPQKVLDTLQQLFQFGITRLCPTLVTNSFEALSAGFSAIRAACEKEDWAQRMVPGCHLEGPYISAEDGPRGAHPRAHVRPPDVDEFRKLQEISGNRIRLLTMAPEWEGAATFIRETVQTGVRVSIGHTAASSAQISDAVDAGATMSTHLGNGAHATLPRHPNYIWDQLGDSRLFASIIADGHHLPPSVVRTVIAAKTPGKTILTSDASGWAGCPPDVYEHPLGKVEVLPEGRVVVFGHREYLAGSCVLTDTCVANALHWADLSLAQAVDMAGRNPARVLGFEDIRVKAGCTANLVLFQFSGPGSRLEILATFAAGVLRHGSIP